ncbi:MULTISPECIES: nicotinate-nucleotide--dimethylbenzimidazole phosphoribosyltransferase [unclassified Clostridium]|uniref:nicotinate-nucleotide--dimethylbenzimidazole phosphoribosyltransferase n=1 Tax=unclassified Clostridium TaxID=2614128 RepID=UPI0025C01FD4|nr:nicotinate-nucleotide--dimethylbenzimidazole phosphoribosyltransferase [Clostridium sp.]MCI6693963.1 nicotinate-nucleotide--dimethylbenzimidazole phosphoribosyltransferase [Clostridium sp.]MDY2631627.1 nicotinate-nucleotide--dimethylbenzimidazole phosphoribosyltransferase [Clostridium sp.]MDY4251628.1 nicotinate-nucleotide--dimethylbenzimidazole phosphoribosyltransferase [Clostridium sp.]
MNYKNEVFSFINNIEGVNEKAKETARERMNILAKPLGSLGKLEELAIKLSGITGKVKNRIDKKCIIILSSDNGVVEEGVASSPQYVTLAQTINFSKGLTGVAVLAKENSTDLIVVDIGVNCDGEIPGAINKKIRKGTYNIAKGEAMSYEEALKAIYIGIDLVRDVKEKGYDILGVGEMGIGNTTTSSAVLASLVACEIDEVVGKGAGLTDEAFILKKEVVKKAIEINKPNREDPIDVIAKVGGFDLAGMVGVYLGAAYYKLPIVIDGFISVVAALVATKLCSKVKDYLIPSHVSKEIGYSIAINNIGLEPMLNLDMRLGEGSGCPIAFSIVNYACAIMNNMATFHEAEIDPSYLSKIKDKKNYIVDK